MKNKILAFIKKNIWPIITAIIALGALLVSLFQARTENQRPILSYYTVEIKPEISENDLQEARRALEGSLFQSVNNLVALDSSLTYSEALDKVLPLSKTVGNLSAGVVIVIRNRGAFTANDIRANISLEVPIEDYEIFSNELYSIVDVNKPEGTIKISIDRLTSQDKVQIAILYPGAYTVSLTVSRGEHPTSTTLPRLVATQPAIGSDEQDTRNSSNGFLQFSSDSPFENIETTVFVSSAEVQGDNNATPRNTREERNLFFDAFHK